MKRQRASLDCLKKFRERVATEGGIAPAALDAIDAEVLATIDAAVATAKSAAPPPESDVATDVYASY